MKLEGSLDAFSLPDIFSLLSMTKKTGGLHLRRAGVHGVVWLGDGLITGGASDLSRQALGRRFAGNSEVADNLLSAAVDEVGRNSELGFARALRDSRAIDEGELHTLVSEHVVDTVFDLMRWPDGGFEFVVDEPNVDDVGVAHEVDDVVTEARHRLDIWAAIDERIVSPDTVLSLDLAPAADPQVHADEWSLLALIDGHRTVGDLVAICGRGEYAVVVALAELVGRGLVRPEASAEIAALLRRQALIATVETASPAAFAAPDPVADSAEVAAEPEPLDAETSDDLITDLDIDVAMTENPGEAEPPSNVTDIGSSTAASRRIDSTPPTHGHVEQLAAAGGAMAAAAPASAPSPGIERDPSVNKSLLLRLIAGVQGL